MSSSTLFTRCSHACIKNVQTCVLLGLHRSLCRSPLTLTFNPAPPLPPPPSPRPLPFVQLMTPVLLPLPQLSGYRSHATHGLIIFATNKGQITAVNGHGTHVWQVRDPGWEAEATAGAGAGAT